MIIFKPAKILSVDFISIAAIIKNQVISLKWNVGNETNIAFYIVEKSSNGLHFEKISKVSSTNRSEEFYNYTDSEVSSGTYFYRIKGVDTNGTFSYSKIVHASVFNKSNSRIWPNPVQLNEIRISVEPSNKGAFKVRLFNSGGELILQKQLNEESRTLILKTQKLASGIYYLELTKPTNEIEILEVLKVGN